MSSRSQEKVKNVLVFFRANDPNAKTAAHDLVLWLKKKPIHVSSYSLEKKSIPGTKSPSSADLKKTDLVIVLGGDGTYLRAVQFVIGYTIPILGINLGSLGFLTETPLNQMYKAVERCLKSPMEIQERTLLDVQIARLTKSKGYYALNDLVVERGPSAQLIRIKVFCDNSFITDLKADGIIIATPTGSTAYNLASGGPIVHPEAPVFVVSPICPHSLTARPIIIPENHTIKIELGEESGVHPVLIDGAVVQNIKGGQEILIKKAQHSHLMCVVPDGNYFELLREKLQFGQRL